jgi:hypothetical protein
MGPPPSYRMDGGATATHHELSDLTEQHQPSWNGTDNYGEVNQQGQDVVMGKDEHGSGAETPQVTDAKAVEMQAKSGMPMLIPGLGGISGGGINASDGMDVDDLPIQVLDRA